MKASYINYQDTQSFSAGLLRYLANDTALAPFYNQPANLEGFKKSIQNKKTKADRQVLVKVLQEQYARLASPTSSAVRQNIALLLEENTFTITTGHQLNLFTGPLYFIYKIATAIKLARELKAAFPEKNFVPVYWMATEDHDFAEINHTYVSQKKISWDTESAGATGRLSTSDLSQAIKAYRDILGASANAAQLGQWITEAYSQHANLADASRYLVNQLFREYGLVIIDADHVELKKQFASIIEKDITGQHSFACISASNQQLKETGIEPTVNPREINFFYLKDNIRERIVFKEGHYSVLNTDISFSETALKHSIQEHPEYFSPNVVMRPLYQETVLPNLAYIGGGAEVLYWLQLKSTFEHYGISYPVLVLRNSAQLISEQQQHQLKRLGFEYKDAFKSAEELKKEWLLQNSKHSLSLSGELAHFKTTFEQIKVKAQQIDTTLVASTAAVEKRLDKALQNLEKKLLKAEKRNHQEAMEQIEKLSSSFFPQGGLQERSENFGLYFAAQGPAFITTLIEAFKPLDFKFTILAPSI